jgi:RsmE family RNA methyltransferase
VNLLLFKSESLTANNHLVVTGQQHKHLKHTLRIQKGERLSVGEINGLMGSAQVVEINENSATLEVALSRQPPQPLPLTLVLAMPRPKMFRRVMQMVASLGVKEIHLINSYRVEKSFWQTPFLQHDAIEQQLLLGLEQCGDTLLPALHIHKLFKPFVEDLLPGIVAEKPALVAHPYNAAPCPVAHNQELILAIGPEGGFIPYEIGKLEEVGFTPVSLGERILRVETAVPVLISRLFCG